MSGNALPPLLRDLDVSKLNLQKVNSAHGKIYNIKNEKGRDVEFYFGKAMVKFAPKQDTIHPSPDPDCRWVFTVTTGWPNSQTAEQEANEKKLDEIYDHILDKIVALPEEDQLLDDEAQPFSKEKYAGILKHPIKKNNRSKSKIVKNEAGRNEFQRYEPVMKWNVPFGFRDNKRVFDEFLKRSFYKVFVDEDDVVLPNNIDSLKKIAPDGAEVEIFGRLTSVFLSDTKGSLKFDTLNIKRLNVPINLGQEIDTSIDYLEYLKRQEESS